MAEDNDVVVVDPVDDDNAGAASSSEQKQYHPIFSCPVFFYKTGESEFGRKIKVEVQLNANANLSKAKNDIWWVKLKYFDYITLGRRINLHEYAIFNLLSDDVCIVVVWYLFIESVYDLPFHDNALKIQWEPH